MDKKLLEALKALRRENAQYRRSVSVLEGRQKVYDGYEATRNKTLHSDESRRNAERLEEAKTWKHICERRLLEAADMVAKAYDECKNDL